MAWLKPEKTGSWRKFTIGPYPDVGFARARAEMQRLRTAVLDGEDPFERRTAGRGRPSVKELGEAFIKRYAKPNKKRWSEDERILEHDVYPVLGDCRADLVTKLDVVRLLDGISDRGAPIQANRTLALVRKLFNWGVAEGYLQTANPASGVPARAKENVRRRVLTEEELRAFWHALDGPGFEDVTADALRLQLLLGARILEVTGMARTELALGESPTWTLPAIRAKANRDVPRPLPHLALAILRRRLEAAQESPFVFASPIDLSQPIIAQAPTRALRRAGETGRILPLPAKRNARGRPVALKPADRAAFWDSRGFTPHDLRRTCRTFFAKLGIAETVAKKILGHVPPRSDVTASVYDQHNYLPEMREALERWEAHLLRIVGANAGALEVAA
jgi:integrase